MIFVEQYANVHLLLNWRTDDDPVLNFVFEKKNSKLRILGE